METKEVLEIASASLSDTTNILTNFLSVVNNSQTGNVKISVPYLDKQGAQQTINITVDKLTGEGVMLVINNALRCYQEKLNDVNKDLEAED